ncbi:MAG: hypothetical protein IJ333_05050 [Clostridia bacterium]|nr:hypothetical protein [Clostridia bacterium]
MFLRSLRRPYITSESELELYNDCKNRICTVEKDLKLNYKKIKEQNRHFVLRDNLEFTFYETTLWICNDDLHIIANEGVYYLMTFISLGILGVEFNENVDFIKMELRYILEKKLLENSKERINIESFIEMQQDLNGIQRHFDI